MFSIPKDGMNQRSPDCMVTALVVYSHVMPLRRRYGGWTGSDAVDQWDSSARSD